VLLFLRPPVARVAPGLSALAHYATVRLYITRERWLRPAIARAGLRPAIVGAGLRPAIAGAGLRLASLRGQHGDIRGYEGKVEILKNRLGPAGRIVTITIRFNGTVRGEGL
jgi:hypothetical protein